MASLFYRCEKCGNFITFVGDKTACTPKCCGEPMTKLIAKTVDSEYIAGTGQPAPEGMGQGIPEKVETPALVESIRKHVPDVTVDGEAVLVIVGSILHPMTEDHYIQFIHLETENGGQFRFLKPDSEPKAVFHLAGEKPVAVYEYCTKHGLWGRRLSKD